MIEVTVTGRRFGKTTELLRKAIELTNSGEMVTFVSFNRMSAKYAYENFKETYNDGHMIMTDSELEILTKPGRIRFISYETYTGKTKQLKYEKIIIDEFQMQLPENVVAISMNGIRTPLTFKKYTEVFTEEQIVNFKNYMNEDEIREMTGE